MIYYNFLLNLKVEIYPYILLFEKRKHIFKYLILGHFLMKDR